MDPQINAAAAAALQALQAAAANAAKPGTQTSEWRALLGGIALTSLLAGLHVLAVVPGPWMLPAVLASAAVSIGAYALSRGAVKAAALKSAAVAVATLRAPLMRSPPPPSLDINP